MKKPNVILMFIDDLGYGDISCLNEKSKIQTPHVDALGERGIIFTDEHATSALCTPSRYSLLTGRYNWRSRLKQGVLSADADILIEKGRMTLADLFKKHGYFTAAVGKWHIGMEWHRKEVDGTEYGADQAFGSAEAALKMDGINIDYDKPIIHGPNQYGFDYFFGTAASLDSPPYTYIENDHVLEKPDHVSGEVRLQRKTALMNTRWQIGPAAPNFDINKVIPDMQKKVLDLIDAHAEEPFFIYYPTHAVHQPLLPPPEWKGKSGLNIYADMVLYMDHMVGEITEKLKEKGIWENTIFLFLSDNGCSGIADYPFLLEHGHNPSYIFRGKKADIWEGGHRVPSIISWPDMCENGRVCPQMVSHSDWLRTFSDILGDKLPDNAGEDSVSILSLLEGDDREVRENIVHSSANGSFSIRNKKWKLELCSNSGTFGVWEMEPDDGSYQLYDLRADIGEQNNRITEFPEEAAELKKDLLDIIANGRSTPGAKQENYPMVSWVQLEKLL